MVSNGKRAHSTPTTTRPRATADPAGVCGPSSGPLIVSTSAFPQPGCLRPGGSGATLLNFDGTPGSPEAPRRLRSVRLRRLLGKLASNRTTTPSLLVLISPRTPALATAQDSAYRRAGRDSGERRVGYELSPPGPDAHPHQPWRTFSSRGATRGRLSRHKPRLTHAPKRDSAAELFKISGLPSGVECSRPREPLVTQDPLFASARNLHRHQRGGDGQRP